MVTVDEEKQRCLLSDCLIKRIGKVGIYLLLLNCSISPSHALSVFRTILFIDLQISNHLNHRLTQMICTCGNSSAVASRDFNPLYSILVPDH